MPTLTQKELAERIAILKRFRTLLEQQRSKFREYLVVLEKQQNSITTEDAAALFSHTELGQQVVANIAELQKVIVPANFMYKTISGNSSTPLLNDTSIQNLQDDLSDLQAKILTQNEKNRNLLKIHISQIKTQLNALKNPYAGKCSVYAEKAGMGKLVEIEV
jgi:hypothetical protein